MSINNQTITFCGVAAHHQNGFVENHIGRLSRGSRTVPLASQRRWPDLIVYILWPFAWKDYDRCYNELFIDNNGVTPIEKSSSASRKLVCLDFVKKANWTRLS